MMGTAPACIAAAFLLQATVVTAVNQTVFTLYTMPTLNWQMAVTFCRDQGQELVRVTSQAENAYLTSLGQDDGPWYNKINGQMWSSLHDPDSSTPGHGYQWQLQQAGSCLPLNPSSWTNWGVGEPLNVMYSRCIGLEWDNSLGFRWRSEPCETRLPRVICQTSLGNCSYQSHPNKTISSSAVQQTIVLTLASQSDCLQECLNASEIDLHCWAAEWTTDLQKCKLRMSQKPFASGDMLPSADMSLILLIPQCFTSRLNDSVIKPLVTVHYNPECSESTAVTTSTISPTSDTTTTSMTTPRTQTTTSATEGTITVLQQTTVGNLTSIVQQTTTSQDHMTSQQFSSNDDTTTTATTTALKPTTRPQNNMTSQQFSASDDTMTTISTAPNLTTSQNHLKSQQFSTSTDIITTTTTAPKSTTAQNQTYSLQQPTTETATTTTTSTSKTVIPTQRYGIQCACARQTNASQSSTLPHPSDFANSLVIDRKQTSQHRRKYVSVPDNRPSAQTIGSFGVVFLVVAFSVIVAMDLSSILCSVKQTERRHKDIAERQT